MADRRLALHTANLGLFLVSLSLHKSDLRVTIRSNIKHCQVCWPPKKSLVISTCLPVSIITIPQFTINMQQAFKGINISLLCFKSLQTVLWIPILISATCDLQYSFCPVLEYLEVIFPFISPICPTKSLDIRTLTLFLTF